MCGTSIIYEASGAWERWHIESNEPLSSQEVPRPNQAPVTAPLQTQTETNAHGNEPERRALESGNAN